MEKRAEVSTSFLVSMILIILGFAIVLLVFFQFNWNDTVDKEACHTSVILRGTLPDIAKSYSPLKCQTEKVCITKGGLFSSPCNDIFAGVKSVTNLKITSSTFNKVDNDAKTEMERAISQQVIDCWTMMGKGKISIENAAMLKQYALGKSVPFCVICSRIAVDKTLAADLGVGDKDLATVDPYDYMKTHKIPGGEISYLDDIIGNTVGGKGTSFGLSKSSVANFDEQSKKALSQNQNNFTQLAVIFVQASAPDTAGVLDNYLKTFFLAESASFIVSPSISAGINLKALKLAGDFPLTTLVVFAIAAGYVEYNNLNNQALTASYCGDLSTPGNAKKGCSVIRVVPYNAKEINSYCGIIDGLP